jgi:hypothetical protein
VAISHDGNSGGWRLATGKLLEWLLATTKKQHDGNGSKWRLANGDWEKGNG